MTACCQEILCLEEEDEKAEERGQQGEIKSFLLLLSISSSPKGLLKAKGRRKVAGKSKILISFWFLSLCNHFRYFFSSTTAACYIESQVARNAIFLCGDLFTLRKRIEEGCFEHTQKPLSPLRPPPPPSHPHYHHHLLLS